ncbi:ABC transporter substrate-binding protein [Bradyrhizobium sp. CCGUVB1N3]|uniref:ABC transporter substrate-binding protein n=1 Tax=Bradyrhizobium sp. CCGUVB1N3 TaxID=2949629 RepID=UPI0020B4322F|nr:ABC transporter substrate-binding protein [Bradyrhizobium sp. CCGUVB1N3]MCP3475105.1 ABC transporter substrate-binding protein [Bradyrhizobium sp. CCGUVB1N3]
MRRRDFIAAVGVAGLRSFAARGQQPTKMKRVAMVHDTMKAANMRMGGDANYQIIFEELKRLGYVEGQNLIVDRYSAVGRLDSFRDVARDVVSTQPDVVFLVTDGLAREFLAASSTIPIVALTGDPVAGGLVSGLAQPGRNITGVSIDAGYEVQGKRLALFGEAIPRLRNVRLLGTKYSWESVGGRAIREAAQKLGISLQFAALDDPANEAAYRRIFNSMRQYQVDGILFSSDSPNYIYRFLLVELANESRIPAIGQYRDATEAGGLMSYSYDVKGAVRRIAQQIAEVLNGAKPSDMPYFLEARFELVINLKTAKALGLEIPAGLIARADAVIE